MRWVAHNWFMLAVAFSVFWGIYGVCYEKCDTKCSLCDWITMSGAFISEFIGSFAGWCCFHILTIRLYSYKVESVDILLIIVTVVLMAGYSYKLIGLLKEYSKGKIKDNVE
jgi:hypothetical protein